MRRCCRLIAWIGMVWLLVGYSQAAERGLTFYAGFDRGVDADTAIGDGRATPDRAHQTMLTPLTQEGKGAPGQGKGVVIAKDNLSDFKKEVMKTPAQPLLGLNYSSRGVLNPGEGTIDFWIRPFFNQTEPYGPHAPQSIMLGYLFESRQAGSPSPGISIHLLIPAKNYTPGMNGSSLNVNFDTSNRTKGSLTVSPLRWEPRTWHRVTFTWSSEVKTLWVDGEKKAESKVPGELVFGESFTIGAVPWFNSEGVLCDFSCISQCIFDEIRIYNTGLPL